MFKHLRSEARTEHEAEEPNVEFLLGEGRVSPAQALPGHRASRVRSSMKASRCAAVVRRKAAYCARRASLDVSPSKRAPLLVTVTARSPA
jgi:hypothetical protein